MAESEDYELSVKTVILGDSGVGKSQIMTRFTKNEFSFDSKATIGVEFDTKMITVGNSVIKCQIWDTAGQERYRSISQAYYKNAYGALLVYDITRRVTFENAGKWLKELKEHAEKEISIILVGNKTDLKEMRQVPTEEGTEFAKQNGLFFTETSALENEENKIEKAFQTVMESSSNALNGKLIWNSLHTGVLLDQFKFSFDILALWIVALGVYQQKNTVIRNTTEKSGYLADKKGVSLAVGNKKKDGSKNEGCKC